MIKETIVTFTEEDYELLSKAIPDNPCIGCLSDVSSCCGCPNETKYKELMKPYKEAGIEEYALKIKRIRDINEEIRKLECKADSIKNTIPSDIRDAKYWRKSKIFGVNTSVDKILRQIDEQLKDNLDVGRLYVLGYRDALNTLAKFIKQL